MIGGFSQFAEPSRSSKYWLFFLTRELWDRIWSSTESSPQTTSHSRIASAALGPPI
jgi:hypothetical protein